MSLPNDTITVCRMKIDSVLQSLHHASGLMHEDFLKIKVKVPDCVTPSNISTTIYTELPNCIQSSNIGHCTIVERENDELILWVNINLTQLITNK